MASIFSELCKEVICHQSVCSLDLDRDYVKSVNLQCLQYLLYKVIEMNCLDDPETPLCL